ncbi:alpha/beta hydrolase family protein [Roseateles sp. NT4]|uniref:alpha/beta hydrolase family protein n=1 Tax=Roseateles sp. NT4 TaxID=3453715 RepID=UPI003EE8D8CC
MSRLLLLGLGLACAVLAHAQTPPPPRAGEAALSWPSASAALRSEGKAPELRALVWYPARSDAREVDVAAGPVFNAGRVAPRAPWADEARHPLVLLSHGFGGAARQMTWLGEALARAGYVAVAVDHPGTNGVDGVTPAGAYAPWERAADLRLALERVLNDAFIGSRIDREWVGVVGFSIGGWTAALLLGAKADFERFRAFCRSAQRDAICDPQVEFDLNYARQREELQRVGAERLLLGEAGDYREPRLKAGVLLAPALAQAIVPDSLARIGVPVLLMAGDADAVVPTPSNAAWLQPQIQGSRLQVLPGVGHYDFLSLCTPAGRGMLPLLCAEPGPARRAVHDQTVEAVLGFLARTLRPAP